MLRKILSTQLKKLGHTPVLACDGNEVLERLKNEIFDLVLMDLEMPGLDGHEATRRLRLDLPANRQPAVVALTAHDIDAIRASLIEEGMDDALSKPIKLYALTKLLVRVPRLLRTRRAPVSS